MTANEIIRKYGGYTLDDILQAVAETIPAAGWQTDSNPDEYGAYLVTVSGINGPRVEIAKFGKMPFDDRRRRPCWYQHDPEWGEAEIKILAWRTLPEPYKGGK